MALPTGTIKLSQIAGEFGGSAPHSLSEYRGKGGTSSSGSISLGQFRGKSGWTPTHTVTCGYAVNSFFNMKNWGFARYPLLAGKCGSIAPTTFKGLIMADVHYAANAHPLGTVVTFRRPDLPSSNHENDRENIGNLRVTIKNGNSYTFVRWKHPNLARYEYTLSGDPLGIINSYNTRKPLELKFETF